LHGMICANVVRILGNYTAQRKKGYVCSNDTGVIVGRNPDTVRGPDVLLFEDAETEEQVEEKYGETPPILAVEVLSPNDTHGKVMRRVLELVEFGTRLVWVLDPDARNVIVHYPGNRDRVVEESKELTGNDFLPEFRCRVAEFFVLPGKSSCGSPCHIRRHAMREILLKSLQMRPSLPLRLRLTCGAIHEVRDPALARLTPFTLRLGRLDASVTPPAIVDHYIISLDHIVSLEPLDT